MNVDGANADQQVFYSVLFYKVIIFTTSKHTFSLFSLYMALYLITVILIYKLICAHTIKCTCPHVTEDSPCRPAACTGRQCPPRICASPRRTRRRLLQPAAGCRWWECCRTARRSSGPWRSAARPQERPRLCRTLFSFKRLSPKKKRQRSHAGICCGAPLSRFPVIFIKF